MQIIKNNNNNIAAYYHITIFPNKDGRIVVLLFFKETCQLQKCILRDEERKGKKRLRLFTSHHKREKKEAMVFPRTFSSARKPH